MATGVARAHGLPVVYSVVPIRTETGVAGAVHVALPLVELAAQIRHIRSFIAWTVLGTLLWAVVVSLLLAQRLARPIQEMRAATGRLAAGELGVRVPVRTADELGDLARALNYMAAELQRLDDLRRDFVADASHELRTPVANLAVAVEALRGRIACDDPSGETLLRAVEREVDRLRTLVEHLLDLSAIETGRVHLHLVPTDLAGVVRDVVGSFQPRTAQRRVILDQRLPAGGVVARTDPERLAQILGNLLDNAVKFTPAGGRVTVSLAVHRGLVTLAVDDTGPGIPPEDLPHIFDRFYKADRARSDQPGAGLGLAIAQRLAVVLGGRIEAGNRPEGGARFVVTLPG
ncbi:MAG: ATP-binding protein [Armatimonadota bacterium]|nr:ATP-binding protein [Armatimonadota bacterium]MDR7486329.1 ATP-binding protein [Armatimonadota bacterium]MDR7532304.1 ATP-binding protein [Armatimonadota bacterium]